jgi:adenylylsulfate kinase
MDIDKRAWLFAQARITRTDREARNGHRGLLIWLTGLSGAGKSTLAHGLEERLFEAGKQVFVLDGDRIRLGLSSDLGFSAADRRENIRRVAEVAGLFVDAGMVVICAFVSPSHPERDLLRETYGQDFVEVFVNCPLEECERRDPKGLYKQSRKGTVGQFTGVSAPYEPPRAPELVLDTSLLSPQECVSALYDFLSARSYLNRPAAAVTAQA